MTQRASFIGGIVSFTAVTILSLLSRGLLNEGEGLQHLLFPPVQDSVHALEDPDSIDPGGWSSPAFLTAPEGDGEA